jgi:hypothetical protein
MDNLVPDKISYKMLLDVLCFKCLIGIKVDENTFTDLLFDLAELHTIVCTENRLDPGFIPEWIMLA